MRDECARLPYPLALLLLAALLVACSLVAAPASAQEVSPSEIKRDADVVVLVGGRWTHGSRGGTGSNGHWYTTDDSAYAYWEFGFLHAVFKPFHFFPEQSAIKSGSCSFFRWGCESTPPTASPKFEVQQKNANGVWVTKYFLYDSIRDGNGDYVERWRVWTTMELELDGEIRVKASKRYSGDTRLSVDSFKLERIGDLPQREEPAPPTPEDPPRVNLELTQEGNNVDGTLSKLYQDLYDEYNDIYHQYDRTQENVGLCEQAGKSTDEPWRKGHYIFPLGECTSWVQFRLQATVDANFDNGYRYETLDIPWNDAQFWDERADNADVPFHDAHKKDLVPKAHSVAQWNPGGYAGSAGHVAFVEHVSEDGKTIWISEMNYAHEQICQLRVQEISKGAFEWPDNFIEFPKRQ